MKKFLHVFFAAFLCLSCVCPGTVFCGIGISVNSESWDVGTGGQGEWQSPQFTVTNIGDEPAKVNIRATDTQNWTLGQSPAQDVFAMQFGDGSAWNPIDTTNTMLVSQLNGSQAFPFFLRYQSPLSITPPEMTETQNSIVTLSVVSAALSPAWAKAYGTEGNEMPASIIQTSDGGFILGGTGDVAGIIKLTSGGDIAWAKDCQSGFQDLQMTDDGGFMLLFPHCIAKLNADASSGWVDTFDIAEGADPGMHFYQTALDQANDGGYIIAGMPYPYYNGGAHSSDIIVVKLDHERNIEWHLRYSGSSEMWSEDNGIQQTSIQQTSDGGYILATHSLLTKLSSFGTIAWQKKYSIVFSMVRQTNDGGYIAVGFGGPNIMKLNTSGDIEWQKVFAPSGVDLYSVEVVEDGYAVTGIECGANGAFAAKFALDGSMAWQNSYSGAAEAIAKTLQRTDDGGFVVSGNTNSFGAGDNDYFVVKLNPDGTCSPLSQNESLPVANTSVIPEASSMTAGSANIELTERSEELDTIGIGPCSSQFTVTTIVP